jgi:hypothetical protein
MGQTRTAHDLRNRDAFETAAIEQPPRAFDDFLPHLGAMTLGVWHVETPLAAIASAFRLRILA